MNQLKNDHTYCEFPSEFFDLIFQNSIESNSLDIEVRLRNDKHVIQRFYRSNARLRKDWSYIQAHNHTLGYDVDFTVVPRKRIGSSNKEHPLPELPILNCFWADIDVGEDKPFATRKAARKRIIQVGPYPTILVKSGQGLHVYYCLKRQKRISVERAENILKNLAKKLEADPVAARVKRLMRVPNTINHKYGKLVRYAVITGKQYSVKRLERRWREETRDHSSASPRKSDKPATTYERFFAKYVDGFARSRDGSEGTGLCPFHNDHRRSFSADVKRGLWKCHATGCNAKGNIKQFCQRLGVPSPDTIMRFPRELVLSPQEEWPSEKVFRRVYRFLRNQIHFTQSWQTVVVTLWAVGTYLYWNFPCYGHLWINSPTTQSGKSKLLTVLWAVCYKAGEPQLEPTPAVLFRWPSGIGGTLLLDEVDNLDPQKRSEVIAILNSYYSWSAVTRAVPNKGRDFSLKNYPTYCPKVIAGINNLPTTLQGRCIKILLHRKKQSEEVDRFMPETYKSKDYLRKQLQAWAMRDAPRIKKAYEDRDSLSLPDVDDRAKDMLEPLFATASVLPKWVRHRLIEASEYIGKERTIEEAESNPIVIGLQILKEQFPAKREVWNLRTDEVFRLFSEEISSIETKSQAQALLRKLGFKSKRARIGNSVLRAYRIPLQRLTKLCERYAIGTKAT